jgi:hypothetical protein
MLGPFWAANIALAVVNMCVVAGVLYVYAKNFGVLHSRLALGLIAFSSILVAQNVVAAFMYWQLAQTYTAAVATPILLITALETTGLLFLFWVTWR